MKHLARIPGEDEHADPNDNAEELCQAVEEEVRITACDMSPANATMQRPATAKSESVPCAEHRSPFGSLLAAQGRASPQGRRNPQSTRRPGEEGRPAYTRGRSTIATVRQASTTPIPETGQPLLTRAGVPASGHFPPVSLGWGVACALLHNQCSAGT